jgi:DNA-binding FrmR family transcriptional regulator
MSHEAQGHDEHVHTHVHSHEGHPHVHSNKKAVLGRLKRASGHLDSVIRMVDSDRDCSEVLIQLAAVRAALNNAGKVLLRDHIRECITEAVFHEEQDKIDELNRAIEQFMK